MNGAHFHLVWNHLPVIGAFFSLLLLAWGLIRRSVEIQRVGLAAVIFVALTSIPTFLSGEPAEHVVEHWPGVEEATIHEHEEMAEIAFVGALVAGVAAAVAFVLGRKDPNRLFKAAIAVFVINFVVYGLMAYTAYLGGLIRHPEIRAEAVAKGETGAMTKERGEARDAEHREEK
jgi:uncharacterized membrane protein